MKFRKVSIISLVAIIALSACGSKQENNGASGVPVATPSPEAAASQAAGQPTASAPQSAAAPPAQPAPEPVKPPEPKKYVVAAGTPISVRTVGEVNTKAAKNGNEFEATLESPLVAEGHTVAKRGATVVGRVVNADQGGRVKGKASLTLALARLRLANGQPLLSRPIPSCRKPRAVPART